jgi:hypothetical protein
MLRKHIIGHRYSLASHPTGGFFGRNADGPALQQPLEHVRVGRMEMIIVCGTDRDSFGAVEGKLSKQPANHTAAPIQSEARSILADTDKNREFHRRTK